MPISSPSYFPPAGGQGQIVGTTAGINATGVRTFLAGLQAAQNTQINDLIVVGHLALSAGTLLAPLTDPGMTGEIVIGSGAALAQTVGTAVLTGSPYGSIIIGKSAAPAAPNISSSIILGMNALKTYAPPNANNNLAINGSVVVGAGAMENLQFLSGFSVQCQSTVVIGAQAAQGNPSPNNNGGVISSVIIGAQACQLMGNAGGGGGNVQTSVVIGTSAALSIAQTSNVSALVIIGQSCATGLTGAASNLVIIGQNCAVGNPALTNSVAIGQNCSVSAGSSVVLGQGASTGGMTVAQTGGVFIGAGAGTAGPVGGSDQFVLETVIVGVQKTLAAGNFGTGSIVLGQSSTATNRDLPGTNIVKLLAGTKTGVAPNGGGFFYLTSTDNAIHYVDSTNQDSAIGPSGAAFFGTGLGVITPAALAANTSDYAPAGFANAQVVRISASAAVNLTGLAGGAAGRWVILRNVGANAITLTNQDVTSAAANRFSLPGAASLVLGVQSSVELWYDTTTGNWASINR